LDFVNVRRFSSEGISACLQVNRALADADCELRLAGLLPQIREAFQALSLDGTVLSIHDELDEAIASFQP
jgi:anti-anti-sigma regulatory factor